MSPIHGKAMLKGRDLTDAGPIDYEEMEQIRRSYMARDSALGSVPIPASITGVLKSGKEKLQGHNPEVLVNKLGQRLAFERAGSRLYEALISKCDYMLDEVTSEIVSVDRLHEFHQQEVDHFLLLKAAIEKLGADPTAMTPDADASAVASMGIPKVLTEPRTSVLQCLEAIQTAELSDHAGWGLLRELATSMGLTEMADDFAKAHAQEEVHAEVITEWIRKITLHRGGAHA